MALDADRVETVTVDSYGTLVDTTDTDRALADRIDDPTPVSRTWRARSIQYTMVANAIDAYEPFYEINRHALQYALEAHGIDLPPAERDAVLEVYHDLPTFDDVRDGIERLREAGYSVSVLSNGNPAMLESMVTNAGIGDLLEHTISADEIGTFKPEPAIYRHAAERTDTPIGNMCHVAGPTFDVQGASNAGMQACWLDRGNDPWGTFDGEPDVRATSFHNLADALGA